MKKRTIALFVVVTILLVSLAFRVFVEGRSTAISDRVFPRNIIHSQANRWYEQIEREE